MIYTFTPNPAVDYYVRVNEFIPGEINRVTDSFFLAAGKGINVSLLLNVLSIPSTAVYFTAGFTGKYITDFLEGIPHVDPYPIETEGVTRVNVKFLGEQDTAINASGSPVTEQAKEKLIELVETLTEDDVFVISGSLPKNFTKQDVIALGKIVNRKKTKLVLDVPQFTIQDLEELSVFLIKPNLEEFATFMGKDINYDNFREFIDDSLLEKTEHLLLSLGSKGCYYAGKDGRYCVKVPKVTTFSPVGAGDSTLAAFIGTYIETGDIEHTLKMANATGTAKVKHGTICDRKQIEEEISHIELIKE